MRLLTLAALVPSVVFAERGEAPPPVPAAIAARVKLEPIARRLDRPVLVTFAPGDVRRRLFIVEQDGRVKIWEAGAVKPRPFVDVADRITRGGEEQGLLGMA